MTKWNGVEEKSFVDTLEKILKGKELEEFEIVQSGDLKQVEIKIKIKGE